MDTAVATNAVQPSPYGCQATASSSALLHKNQYKITLVRTSLLKPPGKSDSTDRESDGA